MTGRGVHGRRVGRLLLLAVIALDAILALLLLDASNGILPMYSVPSPILGWLIIATGVALNVVGLAWMIRLYPRDPEAHASHWRFDRS